MMEERNSKHPVKYYGKQTEAALTSFGLTAPPQYDTPNLLPRSLIKAYGEVKKASIMAQQETANLYPPRFYDHLIDTVDQVIAGDMDDQFVVPLLQGSAGTSINMNMNEVLAGAVNSRAQDVTETFKAHPLDHINRFQSTNDTLSTVLTILMYRFVTSIEQEVIELQEQLVAKEREYGEILMTGRTEMQDALPITLGQVFGAWAGPIERDRWRIHKLKERCRTIALGGTAIGTCFFAPRKYVFSAEKYLREITGLPLSRSQNLPDQIAHHDTVQEVVSGFRICAANLSKMGKDMLLYSSGMVGELQHPNLQYGSTIMAAKTNPVLLEQLLGLLVQTKHEAAKIDEYSDMGQFQLNAFLPFIIHSLMTCHKYLLQCLKIINKKLLPALIPDHSKIKKNLLSSSVLINCLRQFLSYEENKTVYEKAQQQQLESMEDIIELVAAETDLSKEQLAEFFTYENLTTFSGDQL